MGKCGRLFGMKHGEFIRVFLFENKSKLEHFKSGLLVNCLLFDNKGRSISKSSQNSEKLFDLLIGLSLPVEFVIFHRSMACKLFSTKVSNIGNINKVAKHILYDSHCNTVFYGRISNNKNIRLDKKLTYGLCTCDIQDNIEKILLNNLYRLKITSVSVFPLWVTSAFFSHCKYNVSTPVLFVINYMDYLHIILTDNGYVTYNRSILLENRDKDDEVHNTLNHIKNVINIDINNLIIYEFGDSVVDHLSSCSAISMKVFSTKFCNKTHRLFKKNSIFKVACLGCSTVLIFNTVTSAYKINKTNKQIDSLNVTINNSQIAKDIDAWHELYERDLLNQPNYEKSIKEYTQHRTEKLQNITMYCEDGNKISITEDVSDNTTTDNISIDVNTTSDTDGTEHEVITCNDDAILNDDVTSYNGEVIGDDDTDDYTSNYHVNECVIVNA